MISVASDTSHGRAVNDWCGFDNFTLRENTMTEPMIRAQQGDGVDRRGFLECMAWVGTGVAWSVCGGVLSSRALAQDAVGKAKADFTFAQISDSHIGFNKEPNKDVDGTFQLTMDRINALSTRPCFVIITRH